MFSPFGLSMIRSCPCPHSRCGSCQSYRGRMSPKPAARVNLGELMSAGLPVPPGFIVAASAYAEFCDESDLRDRIERELEPVDVNDSAELSAASDRVRGLLMDQPMPESIEGAIRAAYSELVGADGDAPVAVRSSATAEDTSAASFAGMNETFLFVRGADQLVVAVRRCWSSLFGARTIFYRNKRGFEQSGMDIAVVVQRQIESQRAGVMFTIDPSTGASDRLVIEGAPGLGESVVSVACRPIDTLWTSRHFRCCPARCGRRGS